VWGKLGRICPKNQKLRNVACCVLILLSLFDTWFSWIVELRIRTNKMVLIIHNFEWDLFKVDHCATRFTLIGWKNGVILNDEPGQCSKCTFVVFWILNHTSERRLQRYGFHLLRFLFHFDLEQLSQMDVSLRFVPTELSLGTAPNDPILLCSFLQFQWQYIFKGYILMFWWCIWGGIQRQLQA